LKEEDKLLGYGPRFLFDNRKAASFTTLGNSIERFVD